MAVRSRRLVHSGTVGPGVNTTLFLCPAGRTAIVKTCGAVVSAGTATAALLFIRSSTGRTRVLAANGAEGAATYQHGAYWVLEPGDSLEGVVTGQADSLARFVASGVLLEGTWS